MIEISRKGNVRIIWNCHPHENTNENIKNIREQFSKKYNFVKSKITVVSNVIQIDENGNEISIQENIVNNIQNPAFQQNLFQDYIKMNDIKGIDFEEIIKIDNDINQKIDYNSLEKYGKISIKWIEFSNFLSYGENNRLDFTKLNGLVSVSSEPGNMSGKTSLAIELVNFLIYGKTDKTSTLDEIFNKWNKDATEVIVRGCININGEDFLIERILTRPKKRTTKSKASQTVKYFKVINGLYNPNEPLEDYDPDMFKDESDDVVKTNKVIKESICKESDFRLVSSATRKTLENIIDLTPKNRSDVIKKWVGLLTIEDKEKLAKEKWTKEINPKLLSNQYNTEQLQQDVINLKINIESSEKNINELRLKLDNSNNSIQELEEEKNRVLSTKNKIDENILKLDIQTIETKKSVCVENGKDLRLKEETYINEIELLKNLSVDKDKILNNREKISKLVGEIAIIKNEIVNLKKTNETLESSKKCPTCDREYDKETVSKIEKTIGENKIKIDNFITNGTNKNNDKIKLEEINKELEEILIKIDNRNKIELKLAQTRVEIERGLNQYNEINSLLKEYQKNKEDIDKNNKIDISVNNLNAKIKVEQDVRDGFVRNISQEENNIKNCQNVIKTNEELIDKLFVENRYVMHYRFYLELIGKNGITSILINRVLPIVNSTINNILADVFPYKVEVRMTEKNDVEFVFVDINDETGEEIVSDISSTSGLEATVAALVIRTALCKVSSFSKLNFVLLDEVTGSVADEFMHTIKDILDKIVKEYQFVFLISHNKTLNDWCEQKIIITKDSDGIIGRHKPSRIKANF